MNDVQLGSLYNSVCADLNLPYTSLFHIISQSYYFLILNQVLNLPTLFVLGLLIVWDGETSHFSSFLVSWIVTLLLIFIAGLKSLAV